MDENKNNKRVWIITAAVLAVVAAGIAAFFIIRHNSNIQHQESVVVGDGMFGRWVSDYSECVVTVEEGYVVTEYYGDRKMSAKCSMEELSENVFKLTPVEGEFYFANYYLYEEYGEDLHLTSYIFLDNREQVNEEYISFYKAR